MKYSSDDIAVIIPTKDRPAKLKTLLSTIAGQTAPCARVIIIDGGEGAAEAAEAYADSLRIETFTCHPPGQLRQRKMALEKLDASTRLVCLLDDDMELEPTVFAAVIDFLNRTDEDVAGVGLNLVNEAPNQHGTLGRLFFSSGPVPGRVLPSGKNTPIANVTSDIPTQWLGGGYTVWRQDILLSHPQDDIPTKWAVGEDVRFSYPLSRRHAMYVCAAARARHVHVLDQAPPKAIHAFRARKDSLAKFYLTSQHPELSRLACLWMIIGAIALNGAAWLRGLNPNGGEAAKGHFSALCSSLGGLIGILSPRDALKD